PGGGVWMLWSDSAHPPVFTALGEEEPGFPAGEVPPLAGRSRQVWVQGPGGPVHALLSVPAVGEGPYPTVFVLHGGPDDHDRDAFDPQVAAWTDEGFAVVRVNYRGSTGYGRAWTAALRERVGHTELEDVDAVRRWVIEQKVADPGRLVVSGSSWGGYLALLAVGTRPQDWALALAGAPVADCAAAHEGVMEDIKALDRALFGGSPAQVPERYRDASPSTYADRVRVPVFISAGVNDARCPIGQARAYAQRLRERGVVVEFHEHGAGHSMTGVEERVEVFRRQVAFTRAHL
ncbi:alpha/beta hydrolase family protein, partial [Streptomyces sp. NPDC058662]|uniref:alpha/beta hydrolase family protein n=1 Tax=Streptomyces sp. NPDC058662 TaxID=3346583 RepID=UPI00364DD853